MYLRPLLTAVAYCPPCLVPPLHRCAFCAIAGSENCKKKLTTSCITNPNDNDGLESKTRIWTFNTQSFGSQMVFANTVYHRRQNQKKEWCIEQNSTFRSSALSPLLVGRSFGARTPPVTIDCASLRSRHSFAAVHSIKHPQHLEPSMAELMQAVVAATRGGKSIPGDAKLRFESGSDE